MHAQNFKQYSTYTTHSDFWFLNISTIDIYLAKVD
jgi:hypothetical protein